MRLLATADLHGRLPEIEPCEVLILAGDICPDFPSKAGKYALADIGASLQADWLNTTFREWLTPIAERGTAILAIWGNHDFVGEHPELVPDLPWTLLQDSGAILSGVKFWGTPWVPGLPRWAFYGSAAALKARAELVPDDIDVVISHGPPLGLGDAVGAMSKRGNVEPMNVGDPALNEMLHRVEPGLFICGHIHESRGTYRRLGVPIHNVAHLDDLYEDPMPPVELLVATNAVQLPGAEWG